ncbi:MAG: phosphotransferase [archaeon]
MKLTRKEAEKISSNYNLGKLKTFKELSGGLVNYNYVLTTQKGKFVVKVLGNRLTSYKRKGLDLEFKVLTFLKNSDFPYKVPEPVKNKRGKCLGRLNKKNYWVYELLVGVEERNLNDKKLKEFVKALSLYHKQIKTFKTKNKYNPNHSQWIRGALNSMQKIKGKGKIDKLIMKNLDFFKNLFDSLQKTDFTQNLLPAHRDFTLDNLLFNKGKIIAIIDFGNIEIKPRIYDIANSIMDSCFENNILNKKKFKLFLKEYEKINKLSIKEKKAIILFILVELCGFLCWYYKGMKKDSGKRYFRLKRTVSMAKNLAELSKKGFDWIT